MPRNEWDVFVLIGENERACTSQRGRIRVREVTVWNVEANISLIYLYKMQELSKGIRLSSLDIFSLKTYQDANG
jgi:hypothetical protein